MYSFHFYAGAHIGLISRLKTEVAKIPLFVDEWGTTDHTGHGDLYLENTYKFIEVMNGFNDGDVKLSWCNWSWSNDDGSGACTSAGNYTENTLSPSGKYLMKTLRAGGIPADWNPDDEEEENGTPYGGTPMEIGEKAISDLWLEYYNEGGEGVAYHDNNPSWEYDATKDHGGGCNTGILTTDFRIDECIDVFKMNADELKYYGNKDKAEIFGIGYVDANEWVKYTVDVKRTGFYHVIPYANAYPGSANEISMTVAGKNILRNRNNLSDASVSTVSMKPSDEIYDNNQGYNSYKWTYLHRNETRYGVWLDKGIRTIKIQFGACSGLGSLRFEFDPSTEVGIANVQPGLFGIYPNPTSGGAFTVSLSGHEAGFAAITICNLNGQAVYRTSISTGREMLRPFLPSGIYLITVKTNEQSQTQKLIIP